MRVRTKKSGSTGVSSNFNCSTLGEVIVHFDDVVLANESQPGGADSMFITDLDVEIDGQWKDMHKAFEDKDIIPDNYNEFFAKPVNEKCRLRGYNP